MTREELRQKGCSTRMGDGSELHHCPFPRHDAEEIAAMAAAVPKFVRASHYRKDLL